MTRISLVELSLFRFEIEGLDLPSHGAAGVGNLIARKGGRMPAQRFAVRIETDDGARGEYVTHWVGTPSSFAQAAMLAPHLLGRDPSSREEIWQDLRREVRAYDHMGHGPLDIALWDLAGKQHGASVKALLGGFRDRLPTYASSYHGQEELGGLDSPEAFGDYASQCKEQGFAGFKIHGWHNGDVAREVAAIRAVRGKVGDGFPLMLDPASQLRTWRDALYVGQACDDADFFWYEDPYRDTGGAVEGHKRLRERLKTPLLVCEHVRGIEAKAAFMLAGGGDLVLPQTRDWARHVFHLYVVRTKQRDALAAHLSAKGIQTGIHYPIALPALAAYRGLGQHTASDALHDQLLSIPMGEHLSAADVETVANAIKSFWSR